MNTRILNLTLMLLTALALFFILTSGVPLIQWGWVESWGSSKKPYVRTTRYAFLGLVTLWTLTYFVFKKNFAELGIIRFLRKIKEVPLQITTALLFGIYVVVMGFTSFIRHQALETRGFDLGIFAQAVWNTTQGDFLYSSIKGGICLMGDHVSPILVAMAPLYMLWSDPRVLLFAQVVAAGSCVFMIAWIAWDKLKSQGATILFSVLYLVYFPTRAVLHEDFHPEVLVEPFILLSFIFLEKKNIKAFLLCLLVVITGKENMLGIAFILGFYALIFKQMRVVGAVIMGVSVLGFIAEVSWLVPQLSGQPYLYRGSYDEFWTAEGGGLLNQLFRGDSFEYLAKVFLPFLFVPFFHLPTLMLAAPVFFQNILSENEVMRSFNYHYTTGMTPFVFIACIYGYHALTDRVPILGYFRKFVLLAIMVAGLIKSGAAEYYYAWQSYEKITPQLVSIREKMRSLPPEYSVLTHNNFIPQLVNRKEIYQFDYTTTISKADLAKKHAVDYVIMDGSFWEEGTEPLGPSIGKLVMAGYRTEYTSGSFYMMKREAQK